MIHYCKPILNPKLFLHAADNRSLHGEKNLPIHSLGAIQTFAPLINYILGNAKSYVLIRTGKHDLLGQKIVDDKHFIFYYQVLLFIEVIGIDSA